MGVHGLEGMLVQEGAEGTEEGVVPQVLPKLAEQTAALQGGKGAMLLAFSASEGEELARADLESPPVFDGMAAADSRRRCGCYPIAAGRRQC